ncbi:MAG: hypothetical protein Q7S98_00005, partial [Deltaproteobacteria bacterium]|nr:hypothetical protein [Deltaproteobacteria bacterium]
RNGNGFVDALGESSPNRADTDGDTINDLQEMADCRNNLSTSCRYVCRAGQLLQNDPYLSQVDSDGDGLFDWQEDWNSNCIYEEMIAGVGELNPFNDDTDGDGQIDSQDLCPTDATNSCTGQCRARQNLRVTDPNRDTDRDGLKDWEEDPNDNCIVEQGETDPTNSDTDGDGIIDRFDGCNSAGAPAISPDEFEQGVPTTPEEMTCAREQCVPGLPIPDLKDSDRDGAVDKVEDKNNNCLPETGGSNSEMDRFNPDGDEDELLDGVEDANKNGVVDKNETDPRNKDSDGDEIADGIEDRNHNGRVDADESSPLLQDSDGDKNLDKVEDLNHNGLCDKNEVSCAYLPDSDYDGLPDGAEDCNHNGVHDALEPDSRNADSDGDGLSDGAEDLNANCVLDKGETSPISPTTYGRPDKEFREEAVGLPTGCGMSVIPVSEEASANGARGFLFLGSLTLMLLVALRLRSRKSA